jgi:hypothetical protein
VEAAGEARCDLELRLMLMWKLAVPVTVVYLLIVVDST